MDFRGQSRSRGLNIYQAIGMRLASISVMRMKNRFTMWALLLIMSAPQFLCGENSNKRERTSRATNDCSDALALTAMHFYVHREGFHFHEADAIQSAALMWKDHQYANSETFAHDVSNFIYHHPFGARLHWKLKSALIETATRYRSSQVLMILYYFLSNPSFFKVNPAKSELLTDPRQSASVLAVRNRFLILAYAARLAERYQRTQPARSLMLQNAVDRVLDGDILLNIDSPTQPKAAGEAIQQLSILRPTPSLTKLELAPAESMRRDMLKLMNIFAHESFHVLSPQQREKSLGYFLEEMNARFVGHLAQTGFFPSPGDAAGFVAQILGDQSGLYPELVDLFEEQPGQLAPVLTSLEFTLKPGMKAAELRAQAAGIIQRANPYIPAQFYGPAHLLTFQRVTRNSTPQTSPTLGSFPSELIRALNPEINIDRMGSNGQPSFDLSW